MTTAIGRNVKLEIALTFSTAKNVTGITQASPGVATSSAHGLWQWHRRLLDCARRHGAARRHGHARLQPGHQYLRAAGPEHLLVLGLLRHADLHAGGHLGPGVGGHRLQHRRRRRRPARRLEAGDVVKQILFGLPGADVITIDLLSQTYNSSVMQAIEDAALATTYIVGRITLHDNSVRVFRGVPSRPGESLQRSQLATGQFQIAAKGVALKGRA